MLHRHFPGPTRRSRLGADKWFDAAEFVADLRQACITPQVAQKSRYSAVDGRTTWHEGYAKYQRNRKRIVEASVGPRSSAARRKPLYRCLERVRSRFIRIPPAGAV